MELFRDEDGLMARLMGIEDAGNLFALVHSNREHLRRWLPWVDGTQKAEDSAAFIDKTRRGWEKEEEVSLGIFQGETLIGVGGYNTLDHLNHIGEIGYWLGKASCGRGYMTRMVRHLLNYGFEDLQLNRVVIVVALGNEPSRAIPSGLGFRCEGILRDRCLVNGKYHDAECWALLKREWQG